MDTLTLSIYNADDYKKSADGYQEALDDGAVVSMDAPKDTCAHVVKGMALAAQKLGYSLAIVAHTANGNAFLDIHSNPTPFA